LPKRVPMGRPRLALWGLYAVAAALAAGLVVVAVTLVQLTPSQGPLIAASAGLLVAAVLAVAWVAIDRLYVMPLRRLARSMQVIAGANSGHRVEAPMLLEDLADAINEFARRLQQAETDVGRTVVAAAGEADAERRRLAAILYDLAEGVVVCGPDGLIMLYNDSAVRLLAANERVGLGRSIFETMAKPPIQEAVAHLGDRPIILGAGDRSRRRVEFACGLSHSDRRLSVNLSLIRDDEGRLAGFVMSFTDAAAKAAEFWSEEKSTTPSPVAADRVLSDPRPEFYDFSLVAKAGMAADAGRPLRDLIFVAFDSETTGLEPYGGDEVVSLAGVRIVNGRVLSGDTFDTLVDPGRLIPARSVRFHGITDADVASQPRLAEVVPKFAAFADGAVLVGHNAAFDLAFLHRARVDSGPAFDHPVLDTLLLSVHLEPDVSDHGLDAIAHRFGVDVVDRHSALGDALTTARIFARMLGVLEAAGITTLGQALEAANSVTEIRRAQRAAFGVPTARS